MVGAVSIVLVPPGDCRSYAMGRVDAGAPAGVLSSRYSNGGGQPGPMTPVRWSTIITTTRATIAPTRMRRLRPAPAAGSGASAESSVSGWEGRSMAVSLCRWSDVAGDRDADAQRPDHGRVRGEHDEAAERWEHVVDRRAHDGLAGHGGQPAPDGGGEVDEDVLDDPDPRQRHGDGQDLVADQRPESHPEDGEQRGVGEGSRQDEPDLGAAQRDGLTLQPEQRRGGPEAGPGGEQAGARPAGGADGQLGDHDAVAAGRGQERVGGRAVAVLARGDEDAGEKHDQGTRAGQGQD